MTPWRRPWLTGKRAAILATDGVERIALAEPRRALDEAGARTQGVSPKRDSIKAWQHDHWGDRPQIDVPLAQARVDDYAALMLPGGVMNPDHLGADSVDREVVTDEGLVTSRKPDDIPAFSANLIEEFAEGVHKGRRQAARAASQPETTAHQGA